MGNSARNPQDYEVVRNYREDEWEQLPGNNGELWRSRRTHELAEVHRLFSVPSSIDMDRYELRSSQENFVKVYYLALASRQSLCFNEPFVRLLVEFIPVRLKEVDSLELEEALTLLAAVLKGFHALTAHFGAIEPQEELIGFNQWGKAKVWLNKDVSCNFPEHVSRVNFDKSRVEASHVRKLFDLVQRKSQTGQLPLGLKELFRTNNPGFLQAILIVEKYSYQNQLSLQRYIRTDIVVRKTSALALTRQPSHSRINNREIIVQREMKRMHSVDALHTQRWTNVSQSTVSIPNMQFKENISFNSATQGHRSPMTKVSFLRRQPYNMLPLHNVSSLCSPTRQIQLGSDQTSPLSILGSPQRSIFQPSPIKLEPPHKKMDIFPQVQEQLLVQSLKKEQTQQQAHNQLSSQVVSKQIIQHHQQSHSDHEQEVIFQVGHQSYRSIIDKVNSELMSAEEITPIQAYQQQEFQLSGTFNFRPNQKDQFQHLHYPLQQIGEEEDCSKDRECDSDSKIKEPQEQRWIEREQINNLPIGFQSFAPNKIKLLQTVSFAPNIDNYPTQQSIRSEENVKTSQSFDYDEKEKASEKEDSIQEQSQERALQSSESVHPYQQPTQQAQQKRREMQGRQIQDRKRVSIDIYYQQQQNPFFGHCTPIQSKFDVLAKGDSLFSRQTQREERPSAFARLQTDEEIQNYVRSKYGTYLSQNNKYQRQVKVGRVQSQYQKHYVKETEGYDFARKEVRPSIEIACPSRSNNRISNILEKPEEDFLDVNFLEKSLDKRYSNPKKPRARAREDEDELNIAKLDEGLMKFSNIKGSFADQSSKDGQQESISHRSKWEATTGFQCPPAEEKKKRTVRIETTPTHQFNYQLSSSNYAQATRTTAKSPEIARETTRTGKVSQAQKESIDARYDKYVKNNKEKPSKTPSIAQIAGIRGESRLMLSPIPERRGEDEGRLSYDQLRSFLWG